MQIAKYEVRQNLGDLYNIVFSVFRIGDSVILHYAKPCHRCIVTQVDPQTGKLMANGEPMRTLKTYRMIEPTLDGPIFANQYGLDSCGTVKVGDEVYAEI